MSVAVVGEQITSDTKKFDRSIYNLTGVVLEYIAASICVTIPAKETRIASKEVLQSTESNIRSGSETKQKDTRQIKKRKKVI